MKFRKPEKYDGNGRKAWRESGGKGVFWLMDDCTHDLPLVIVEGEYDALAVKESGYKNVVSVPSGNDDLSCVDNCWEWLEKFNEVIIWPDSDEPGQKMMRNLITRLGDWRCSIVKSHCKDANELLFKSGKESVLDAIDNAEIVPTVGLISLADVEPFDKDKVIRVPSSLSAINQVIGGYMMGQVSIWTGTSSSGKSTFLGQELLNAINKGFVVCCFSGELPSQIFQHWCDLQAAGPNNLESEDDDFREETVYYLSQDTTAKIHDWYKEKFYLIDAFGSVKEDLLIKNFEYAARRYDCKMFVVDNLMTMIFSGSESDFYRKQSAFVGRLVEFSHRLNVHVHVVAHPRKVIGKATKMDVSGTAEITNRADNVFSVTRVDEETKAERNENKLYGDTLIDVLKNRFSGRQDVEISMIFDNKSRRFRMTDNRDGFDIKYGWEYA